MPKQHFTSRKKVTNGMLLKHSPPEFAALTKIEEELLGARLQAVRKALSHSGEKGRTLEHAVTTLIRSFLPVEYGLSTGFVVYHQGENIKLSPQLDIIIYDAIRSGPIARLETCDVFPLEAVYGYIEVKASLQSVSDNAKSFPTDSIEHCLEQNRLLRHMRERRFWSPMAGSTVEAGLVKFDDWIALRSYLFAFESRGSMAQDPAMLAQRIGDFSAHLGPPTHLHGCFIVNCGYFTTIAVDTRSVSPADYYRVRYTTDHGLAAFKWDLLHGLTRFPRPQPEWTAAVDQYYVDQPDWQIYDRKSNKA